MTNKVNRNKTKQSSKQQNTKKTNTRISKPFNIYSELWDSSLMKFLRTALFIIAVILFNLLISRNDYSKFYLFLGVELLLAFIFVVFRLIIQQKKLDE